MKQETLFKNWLRLRWEAAGGWMETYEPRKGSGVGISDAMLLVPQVGLVPFELKMAKLSGMYLMSDEIRPSQIGWHTRLNKFGQRTFFLWCVGLGSNPQSLYIGTVKAAEKWENGIHLDKIRSIGVKNAPNDICFAMDLFWS